jgi:hypothetical protein
MGFVILVTCLPKSAIIQELGEFNPYSHIHFVEDLI